MIRLRCEHCRLVWFEDRAKKDSPAHHMVFLCARCGTVGKPFSPLGYVVNIGGQSHTIAPEDFLAVYENLPKEGKPMLEINGKPANIFIKEAYDLGADLNGPGRYDLNDPVQTELRQVRDWITMAEKDALDTRSETS